LQILQPVSVTSNNYIPPSNCATSVSLLGYK
jgi:hypothetical protein